MPKGLFSLALVSLALMPLALAGCGDKPTENHVTPSAAARIDPAAIANPLLGDAAVLGENAAADGTAPIFVLPENHTAVGEQLEQALFLVRLQSHKAIGGIVLEGATKIPKFDRFSPDVAFGMLAEGDISSAEFMAAGYGVPLIPGETAASYNVDDPKSDLCSAIAQLASYDALVNAQGDEKAIAEVRARGENLNARLDLFEGEAKRIATSLAKPGASECPAASAQAASFATKHNAILADLVPEGSRFRGAFSRSCPVNAADRQADDAQIEENIEDLKALVEFAGQLPAQVGGEIKTGLEGHLKFLESRAASTRIMVEQAVKAAGGGPGPVVMVIGAAHTAGVVAGLKIANVPFAVIKTNIQTANDKSESVNSGKMTGGEVARKYGRLPLRNNLFNSSLIGADGERYSATKCAADSSKKYEITLDQPWNKQKAMTYGLMNNFARAGFGGGGWPPDEPPGGWSNAAASIDPSRGELKRDAQGRVVGLLFPLTLKADGAAQKEVYIYMEKDNAATKSGTTEGKLLEKVKEKRDPAKSKEVRTELFTGMEFKARSYESAEAARRSEQMSTR
ncbi:hypothetical protein Q4F19_08350 [Sphingomonas sp. BIUV-7]|uniref:Haem-binding uptake Tiki superfamily ChaN domain-containing protein n=1 Tax=Sphingomonas natans TaxID=3063330 RepID=A0ABT8Y9L6_9SPHN|nr:hypothetical protein [Sphingomonas sp. BIUV-7]MDO6414389.1 hypothetical protein [Sphingomonas sp. BIUV-7]